MTLTQDKIKQMDAASGLSRDKIAEMDKVVGAGLGETPPSLAQQIGTALVKPAKDYGKMVAGAGYEAYRAGKSALGDKNAYWDEKTRQNVQNPFLDQKELEQFSDPKKASLEGTKRAVGMASYVPAGSLPKAILAGSMYAFSQVDDDAKIDQYVAETLTGGAGGALGYGITKLGGALWSKLTDKVAKIANSAPEISSEVADTASKRIMEKVAKSNTNDVVGVKERVYGSGLPFSKAGHAFDRLKPQETFKTMIEDGVYGTPAQILKKADMVTGENGVLSNIVKESLGQVGDVDIPSGILDLDSITGKYTTLGKKEIGDLTTRLGKSAPGGSISGKNAVDLFDFQRTLEKEAYDVLQKGSSSGKVTEFAQLKLDLAGKIEQSLDKAISESGISSELAKDPAIIEYLNKNVSKNLARKVTNSGGDLRQLRAIQKDYYRIAEIVRLNSQEGSSLGNNYFNNLIEKIIPAVGSSLSALSDEANTFVGTALPVAFDRLAKRAGPALNTVSSVAGKVTSATGDTVNRLAPAFGSTVNRLAPLVGSQIINSGLGSKPPQL